MSFLLYDLGMTVFQFASLSGTLFKNGYNSSPVILRQAVWYNLAIHFVSGLEFHKQLRLDSFNFANDENGLEYVTINHLTQEKTFKGNTNLEPTSDNACIQWEIRSCVP